MPPHRWLRPCSAQGVLRCSFLALSIQQNHLRADHAVCKRPPALARADPPPHSPRPSPQRGGRYLDQISIGATRGPRFSATKVSATPYLWSRPRAETSPLREIGIN